MEEYKTSDKTKRSSTPTKNHTMACGESVTSYIDSPFQYRNQACVVISRGVNIAASRLKNNAYIYGISDRRFIRF